MTDMTTQLAAMLAALSEIPARMAAMERVVTDLRAEVEVIKAALPPVHKSIPEAAKIFGVSIPTMRRWVKARKVPTVTIESTVRVDMSRLHGVDAADIARKADEAQRLPAGPSPLRSC